MSTSDKKSKTKRTKSVFIKTYKAMVTIAPFGLILTILFFLIQAKESKQLVANLTHIEQSLSTRHIGIFPDYLDNINKLLSETPCPSKDTSGVVIFEDILFYGAFYNGTAFKEMIKHLTELAKQGKKITIAYYDNGENMSSGRMFRETVQESWIPQKELKKLAQDRRELMRNLRNENKSRGGGFLVADSIVSEKYFANYRDNEKKIFSERIKNILVPFYDDTKNDDQLYLKMDNIKNKYLDKPVHTISFRDIYEMYHEMTEELKIFYEQHQIKLIPLNNYLTMSCWSNGEKVLFAFPGKFAANEIGFISSDLAILDYIETMLEGVESSLNDEE